ncbi:MAG: hypothetical protein KGV44_03180 [Flavobacteriaceae bacterium]|nr:hypothetical protein [Flavobacteriaceae bacterium]
MKKYYSQRVKILGYILPIMIFTISCGNNEKLYFEDNDKIEDIKINTRNQVKEYLETIYPKFQDSINKNSGFLGWRNVRDYLSLGKETMGERTSKVWYSVYDSIQVRNIVYENIEEGAILLDRDFDNIDVDYISAKEEVTLYSHKIGLSVIAFMFEEVIESLAKLLFGSVFAALGVFCFVFYKFSFGGWIRWSQKRRDKVSDIGNKIFRWGTIIIFISFFVVNWIIGDFTENQLKAKIENNILNKVDEQITKNLSYE